MPSIDEKLVSKVVSEVLSRLVSSNGVPMAPSSNGGGGGFGVYDRMEDAIQAADRSFNQLRKKGVEGRKKAIAVIRKLCVEKAQEWGDIEFKETQIGRHEHKIEKLSICGPLVPGVEWLERKAYSGDYGLTVLDLAPWGVIGAVTPSTHSVPTLTGNAINMIAAGNSVVFNTHPGAAKCAAVAIRAYNEAINRELGIPDLLTTVVKPTLETFDTMVKHPDVRLLCVTGGPGVVKAAMLSGKRAVCAGPGNPPVVIDETADLARAARDIIQGASYDNNLLCIGEKEVFVVDAVADKFLAEMSKAGAMQLNSSQIEALSRVAFESPHNAPPGTASVLVSRKLIGKDASVLAKSINLDIPASTKLLFGETHADHLFVEEEQMMPFLPIVRVPNFETALEMAIHAEHNYKHTAMIHSLNVRNMTRMLQVMDTTLFIKNGPCMTGLGLGGEGFLSFSIATPTGEGVTTPATFTRSRRCVMVGELNAY